MINEIIVGIIAERIIKKRFNPKTNEVFTIYDIIHAGYKIAIENYIIEHSEAV
ncbi:hypothetical protein [Vallitalea maricola]|uniref:Uncharacterized protein n=1 Tax=Vallitalea maricola TaxID=3074433 RepID=A0ACB5UHC9_9FIRM|nr:hypothetical protein AN2V17_15830 [Vallitalea sp. AN17-2]